MATDLLRSEVNERVDLADFQFLHDGSVQAAHRQLGAQVLTDPAKTRSFILDDFTPTNPSGNQVQVSKGRAILATREGGQVFHGYVVVEGDTTKVVDLSGASDGTYGIYVRFEYVDGDSAARVFWNPSGNGSEFSQTIPTRRKANWSMRAELSSPGAEWLLVGEAVVSGGSVTGVTDKRNLYFEGAVDTTYASGWSTDGGGVADDRNADRQQFGVKDFQTFTAAMRQCLEDIKGRGLKRWWDRDIGGMNIGFDADPVLGQFAVGDADFHLEHPAPGPGSVPAIHFHTGNDRLRYDRGADAWLWEIAGTQEMRLDAAGLLVGTGSLQTGFAFHVRGPAFVEHNTYAQQNTSAPAGLQVWQHIINTADGAWYLGYRNDDTPTPGGFGAGGVIPFVIIPDGSSGNVLVIDGDELRFIDTEYRAQVISGNPRLQFAASPNDYLQYDRTANRLQVFTGATERWHAGVDGMFLLPSVAPTGVAGKAYINDVTNLLEIHNGTQFHRYVPQVFSATSQTDTRSATGNFAQSYTVPANTLRLGSTIRVYAVFRVTASSSGQITVEIEFGGNWVTSTAPIVAVNDFFILEGRLTVLDDPSLTADLFKAGTSVAELGGTPSFDDVTVLSDTVDTTASQDVTARLNIIGGTATVQLEQFLVDIT